MAARGTFSIGSVRRSGGAVALRVVASLVLFSPAAHADPSAVVNALRAEGCSDTAAVGAPARRAGVLDAAARELARDAKLSDALARVAYPVSSSTSFHLRGST